MGNVCGLLLFFLISTISCVASAQITSNSPSLHDGDVTTKKLISTTISNAKTRQSIPLEEVEDRRAYGGRKMKNDVVKKAMAEKVSSNKEYHRQANVQSKKNEASSSEQETMADERKGARKQFKTTDTDSFVSYADYPAPHHHPPKNN